MLKISTNKKEASQKIFTVHREVEILMNPKRQLWFTRAENIKL